MSGRVVCRSVSTLAEGGHSDILHIAYDYYSRNGNVLTIALQILTLSLTFNFLFSFALKINVGLQHMISFKYYYFILRSNVHKQLR